MYHGRIVDADVISWSSGGPSEPVHLAFYVKTVKRTSCFPLFLDDLLVVLWVAPLSCSALSSIFLVSGPQP